MGGPEFLILNPFKWKTSRLMSLQFWAEKVSNYPIRDAPGTPEEAL